MNSRQTSLRSIALLEAAKGLLVLTAALALFRHLSAHWQTNVEALIAHFHLNPASKYPRILLGLSTKLTEPRVLALAFGALFYSTIRLLEAYGLWKNKSWALVLGMASAGLYLPVEILEMIDHFSWLAVGVFCSNLVIITILWCHHRGTA
ncbi:DUF2127 domain-containing protein [Methylobacillus gramineus]|uniref:DUF2127 domain-containing protein n=1 Tax=Methylobacillus gramineus TaxID=755169 RepID=UPI001CFF7017|nr:DUF2127 domain-containing protein [Methylobacillus gramineus]MCB5185992.1 DUF2127 domain-containing protein [Methylobacillus gramineus]